MTAFHPPHPDEAHDAADRAAYVAYLEDYGPDGPTTADVLTDEDLEAAALDEVAGPRAQFGLDELARGHTPGPRLRSLADHAAVTDTIPLGWDAVTDEPVVWDGATTGHLAVHTDEGDRVHEADAVALAVAVQAVQVHGPRAVTLVDARPGQNPRTNARWWAPLVAAGMDVRPLEVDPARAVAAVATAADPLHHRRAHEGRRFVVVLRSDRLVDALEDAGRFAYAAATRYALALIHARGGAHGVHLVASHVGPPRQVRPPATMASLWSPGAHEPWALARQYTPHPAEVFAGPPDTRVAVPPPVDPAWWAQTLPDLA